MGRPDLELYFFETIERISRFLSHLDDINAQFYSDEKKILKDKTLFISSYDECLEKVIELLLPLYSMYYSSPSTVDKTQLIGRLEMLNKAIQNLQLKLLIHLPRPTEPVELRRFCRVIRKQIIKLDEHIKGDISIYVNEESEDNSYASDPLEQYKQTEINALIELMNRYTKPVDKVKKLKRTPKDFRNKLKYIHISIPRIDSSNPCHWPVLIHEVSHNLMKDEWFDNIGIHADFINFIKKNLPKQAANAFIKEIEKQKINLESWLIECWCDLFACALIGPSFYFAQFSSFLHSLNFNKNDRYPPSTYRLKLISRFISHRYKPLLTESTISNAIRECETLLANVNSKNNLLQFGNNELLNTLFGLFNHYFINEFFILDNGLLNFKNNELKYLFNTIGDFVNEFDMNKIYSLSDSLNQGFPIPSFRQATKENPLHEKPNTIQEIFLASWIYRNKDFKVKINNELTNISNERGQKNTLKLFRERIVKEFRRLDRAILSSIQISEWVDLLIDDATNVVDNENYSKIVKSKPQNKKIHQLVDRDIYNCVFKNQIKVIPLINIKKQLGSTSLDIRLGTSFEVFFPNQFGIVDFTNSETLHKFKHNSKKYNLDFLDYIPVNPGQFILGHSMEYIKLAKDISADLEGRSSFARLGIEIHMTAGFVDPGFEGVLTFEIFNAGTNPIMLYPGMRIGQLRFTKIGEPSISYSERNESKYSGLLEHNLSMQGQDYEILKIIAKKDNY